MSVTIVQYVVLYILYSKNIRYVAETFLLRIIFALQTLHVLYVNLIPILL